MRIVAGRFKGHILKAPKGDSTRPTSSQLREALFNICRNDIEGSYFLDLFCGSGAIGLEALSRGAISCCFVDKHPLAMSALKENIEKLQVSAKVLKLDAIAALRLLEKEGQSFNIIYVDPPYEGVPKKTAPNTCMAALILSFIDQSRLLKPGGILFVEEGGLFDIQNPLISLTECPPRHFGKSILFQYNKGTC